MLLLQSSIFPEWRSMGEALLWISMTRVQPSPPEGDESCSGPRCSIRPGRAASRKDLSWWTDLPPVVHGSSGEFSFSCMNNKNWNKVLILQLSPQGASGQRAPSQALPLASVERSHAEEDGRYRTDTCRYSNAASLRLPWAPCWTRLRSLHTALVKNIQTNWRGRTRDSADTNRIQPNQQITELSLN